MKDASSPSAAPFSSGGSLSGGSEQAVRLGRERAEREKILRQQLQAKKSQEIDRDRQAAEGLSSKRRSLARHRDEYQARERMQEAEIKEQRMKDLQEEARKKDLDDRRRRQTQTSRSYLQNLREVAALKTARDRRLAAVKRDQEAERRKAETDRISRLREADRCKRLADEGFEREARARIAIVEAELQAQLYQLQNAFNQRVRAHDASLASPPDRRDAERVRDHERARRRMLDAEYADRRSELLSVARLKKSSIEQECRAGKEGAEAERLRKNQETERWYGKRLEELALLYAGRRRGAEK